MADFARLLETLGYPTPLTSESLSWVEDISPAVTRFLGHLSSSLRRGNAVTEEERTALDAMREDGSFLSGGALDEALGAVEAFAPGAAHSAGASGAAAPGTASSGVGVGGVHASALLSSLATERDALRARLKKLEQSHASWRVRRDRLHVMTEDAQRSVEEHRRLSRDTRAVAERAVRAHANRCGSLSRDAQSLGATCDSALVAATSGDGDGGRLLFLAGMDLARYHEQDRAFVRELAALFRAWGAGPDPIVGTGTDDRDPRGGTSLSLSPGNSAAPSRYDLTGAPAPAVQLTRAASVDAHNALEWELLRLRAAYVPTHVDLCTAHAEAAALRASATTVEKCVADPDRHARLPLRSLRAAIESASDALARARIRRAAALRRAETAMRPIAEASPTGPVRADLSLRLRRAAHSTRRAEDMVSLLAMQRARHAVILHGVAADEQAARRAVAVVGAAVETLASEIDLVRARVGAMASLKQSAASSSGSVSSPSSSTSASASVSASASSASALLSSSPSVLSSPGGSLSRPRSGNTAIDARDPILIPTHTVLAGAGSQEGMPGGARRPSAHLGTDAGRGIVTVDTIRGAAARWEERAREATVRLDAAMEQRRKALESVKRSAATVSNALFEGSTTAKPLVAPVPVMEARAELEELTVELATEMDAIMRDRAAKVEALDRSKWDRDGRDLFVQYFTDPEGLKRTFEEAERLVTAHAVKASREAPGMAAGDQ